MLAKTEAPPSAAHVIVVTLPLQIVSVANLREHWRARHKRSKLHRETAEMLMRRHPRPRTDAQITITLTRTGAGRMDSDNLAGGFKAVQDGVADWLGIDDGSPQLKWVYEQIVDRKAKPSATVAVQWDV